MSRKLTLALVFLAMACPLPSALGDGGGSDSGVDAYLDGGLLGIGGCTTTDGSKFIARFQTVSGQPPFVCILASFRRFDGGFAPIMTNFTPPVGYAMDDARYSNDCNIELPNGSLSTVNTAPVTELWGAAEFVYVLMGRPQSYVIDGGIRLNDHVFAFSGSFAGCNSTSAGP